jgi:hypothetical protein
MAKRGQVALEFLSIYSWAFIVILVLIGALTYLGVFKPSPLLPERCSFGSGIECVDYRVSLIEDNIQLRLKSNIKYPIKLNSIEAYSESNKLPCTLDVSGVWTNNEKYFFFENCDLSGNGYNLGTKQKVYIKIVYYSVKSGPEFSHPIDGEIIVDRFE